MLVVVWRYISGLLVVVWLYIGNNVVLVWVECLVVCWWSFCGPFGSSPLVVGGI